MTGKDLPCDGVITVSGTVHGKQVFVAAQDFTVSGGSVGEMHADKICQTMELALKCGAPLVVINDSGGARIQEGIGALSGYGRIFYRNVLLSGVVRRSLSLLARVLVEQPTPPRSPISSLWCKAWASSLSPARRSFSR